MKTLGFSFSRSSSGSEAADPCRVGLSGVDRDDLALGIQADAGFPKKGRSTRSEGARLGHMTYGSRFRADETDGLCGAPKVDATPDIATRCPPRATGGSGAVGCAATTLW
jgi:hypothetical protein